MTKVVATMDQLKAVSFHYTDLETVHSGVEYGECLASELQQRNLQRALVLVSSSLRKASNELESLTRATGDRLVAISDAVGAHSPRPDVMQLLQLARDTEADVLISIGGGSVIDACKAVQLALDQDVRSEEQLLAYAQAADGSRGARVGTVQHPAADYPLRQIAVPTTLSGAEYSNNAGILNPALAAKEGYRAPGLCPQVIIYDAALASLTPEWLWLSTAIRSLDHAVEGLASADCHPYLAGHFLHALRLFAASLPRTKTDPEDPAARQLNQQAVWLACCGLGTLAHGASHGIGYILGSYCAVPHGLTSCVMLPAVLAWNRSIQPALDRDIAAALGQPGLSASEALYRLLADLDLPCSLPAVGVAETELAEIARRASLHPVVRRNPRPINSPAEVEEILQLAWQGQAA